MTWYDACSECGKFIPAFSGVCPKCKLKKNTDKILATYPELAAKKMTWEFCWKCGKDFESNSNWKVWPQGPTCLGCRTELEDAKQKAKNAIVASKKGESMSWDVINDIATTMAVKGKLDVMKKAAAKKPVKSPMAKGEIKKLPDSQTPLYTQQWAVMGSAKMPYIVSLKKGDEWQCSCPAWTNNMPREDCKHILKVKLSTGALVQAPTNVFLLPLKKSGQGQKPEASQPNSVNKGQALDTFKNKGRKFR